MDAATKKLIEQAEREGGGVVEAITAVDLKGRTIASSQEPAKNVLVAAWRVTISLSVGPWVTTFVERTAGELTAPFGLTPGMSVVWRQDRVFAAGGAGKSFVRMGNLLPV